MAFFASHSWFVFGWLSPLDIPLWIISNPFLIIFLLFIHSHFSFSLHPLGWPFQLVQRHMPIRSVKLRQHRGDEVEFVEFKWEGGNFKGSRRSGQQSTVIKWVRRGLANSFTSLFLPQGNKHACQFPFTTRHQSILHVSCQDTLIA